MKQCVYTVCRIINCWRKFFILLKTVYYMSWVWILLSTVHIEELFSIHSNSLFWNHRFAYCTFYHESRLIALQEVPNCLQRSFIHIYTVWFFS
jgi:hypothetical protein